MTAAVGLHAKTSILIQVLVLICVIKTVIGKIIINMQEYTPA